MGRQSCNNTKWRVGLVTCWGGFVGGRGAVMAAQGPETWDGWVGAAALPPPRLLRPPPPPPKKRISGTPPLPQPHTFGPLGVHPSLPPPARPPAPRLPRLLVKAAQLISEKIDRVGGFEAGFQWCGEELRDAGYIKLANQVGERRKEKKRKKEGSPAPPLPSPSPPVQLQAAEPSALCRCLRGRRWHREGRCGGRPQAFYCRAREGPSRLPYLWPASPCSSNVPRYAHIPPLPNPASGPPPPPAPAPRSSWPRPPSSSAKRTLTRQWPSSRCACVWGGGGRVLALELGCAGALGLGLERPRDWRRGLTPLPLRLPVCTSFCALPPPSLSLPSSPALCSSTPTLCAMLCRPVPRLPPPSTYLSALLPPSGL